MGDRETVRQGYEELAETYATRRSVDDRESTILSEFIDSLSAPIRVLDAGCGQGIPVLRQLCEGTTTFGLDFSREQLRIAADEVPTAQLIHGEMTQFPFQDNVFDAVTAIDSLIHIPLSDHQTVIDEFARVLRPNGDVLLSEAPREFERTNSNWLDSDVEMTWNMAGAQATRTQLQNAGFVLINEWEGSDGGDEADPKPPFFAAQLDT